MSNDGLTYEELAKQLDKLKAENELLRQKKPDLKESESKFRDLFSKMSEGFALHEIIYDSFHNPIDYRIIDVNPAFEKEVGISVERAKGAFASKLYGVSPAPYLDTFAHVAETGVNQKFQTYFAPLDRNFDISVFSPGPGYFATLFTDITLRIQEEKSIKNQKQELQILVDSVPAWVFYKDRENRFVSVNEGFCKIMGMPKEQLAGMTAWDLYPKVQADAYFNDDLEVMNSGIPKRKIIEQLTLPDRILWVQTDKIPYYDINGNIIGIIGFMLDITEQIRDEELIRQLSQAVEQSPATVVITDLKGDIEYVNPKFSITTGYTYQEVIGQNPRILKSNDMSVENYKGLWDTITKGNEWRGEFHNKKKNDELYWESASISPIRNNEGKIAHFLAVKEDITERKLTENKLKESQTLLHELNATKDKFFSIIAHDLKSPFNSILGFSDLLVEQVKRKDYVEIEKYAEIIQQASQRALDLLLNLMEWSRSQTGRMKFKPELIEIGKLVMDATELLSDSAHQKSITINMDMSKNIYVVADKAMMGTVIRNLITNAVKFTNQGGEIIISAEQKQNELMVAVKDNGIGIDKNGIEKLFRIAETYSTSGTNNEQGTGLGLILCKEFLEKHGGKIWVESEVGKGSTFFLTIPKV